ncbi:MAG: Dam family site-specific DNA-(adenine-N6)-methyltransferase [Syntrophomonadaceae bacterium]|nr:Dam family site-specific DNA-(adenine-N6)-methyltransferase [Syntrophomonadaceae bacterium]
MVDEINAAKIAQELSISKSYLYKIINDKDIKIKKTKTGRYIWNYEALKGIREALGISGCKYNEISEKEEIDKLIEQNELKVSLINNRRYLGNKYSLRNFIRETIDNNCHNINMVVDLFSGTGSVAEAFKDKMLITNDLLYSNYICNYAWFAPEEYSKQKIVAYIIEFNKLKSSENNYMRRHFADTFFSADDCSKIGHIREEIAIEQAKNRINFKEFAILLTSLLYGMDRIANTVGHYDAYRKKGKFDKELIIPLILPENQLNENNICYNQDANLLVEEIVCDLLYLDPPYNSRQYSDAYHLLENVAVWNKPPVFGVAKKMDRTHIKSDYCLANAPDALAELIDKSNTRYILLSYNNMAGKGDERSNAKISDEEILNILNKKGKVTVFEQAYKNFSTGKSNISNNSERLFLCETYEGIRGKAYMACPLNYTGGKHKLLPQIKPLFPETSCFLDLFAGACNVGINSNATKIIFNDINSKLIGLLTYFKNTKIEIIEKTIDEIIKKYKLSRTDLNGYDYYGCNSSKGLANYNKKNYLTLRKDYNDNIGQGVNNWAMLYVLIVFAFNNQIRFNRKGEFNLPVGKRDFNHKMRNKLRLFCEALQMKDIHLQNKDFRQIDLDSLPEDTFIYCDPPYLITRATYNESDKWTAEDEHDLLHFLNKVNEGNYKFALSNVLLAKNKSNNILETWVKENNFTINYLSKNYSNSNYQRKNKDSISGEVLITNY